MRYHITSAKSVCMCGPNLTNAFTFRVCHQMSGAREPQIESCPGACSLCGSPCAFINPHLFAQSCFCNDCVALGQIRGFGVPDDSRIQELWDGSGADQQAASSRSDANARSRSPRRSHEVTAQNVQAQHEYDEDGATELEDANAEPTPPHQQIQTKKHT